MPTKRLHLTKTEEDKYRTSLSELEEIGIVARGTGSPHPGQERFKLEQIDPEFARVYDLPAGEVAAVVPAKLIVLKSGVMFTDSEMLTNWDEWGLDLSSPEESRSFDDLIQDSPSFPPVVLNSQLVGRPTPLRTCQREGLIIATGWGGVPATYPDEKRVTLELWLRDELGAEFCYAFYARVDRNLKRKYESRRPDPRMVAEKLANRVPLFGHEKAKLGAQHDAAKEAEHTIAAIRNRIN